MCKKGEIISLLAPSGFGKTTILHLIAGIIHPNQGKINIRTSRIGYVFQEHRLIPWKSTLQNLLFVLDEKSKSERERKALKILREVGLEKVAHSYPGELSGGMKQRVSIARAFVFEPELILMDEPFSALDIKLKEDLQNELIQLIDTYTPTVIYVTHQPAEAVKISDKIILLNHLKKELPVTYYKEILIEKPRKERDEAYIHSISQRITRELKGGYEEDEKEPIFSME